MKIPPATWLVLAACASWLCPRARADISHEIILRPGAPAEAVALVGNTGSSIEGVLRKAKAGGGWTYRVDAPRGAGWELMVLGQGSPQITVSDAAGRTIPCQVVPVAGGCSVHPAEAARRDTGGELRFHLSAGEGAVAVSIFQLTLLLPDRHGDGLGDQVEEMMGLKAGERAQLVPRPATAHTGFFLAQPYEATLAVPADAVQLYAGLESTAEAAGQGVPTVGPAVTSSWARQGYAPQVFLHSRYGSDLRKVAAENQTDAKGRTIGVISVTQNGKQVDLAVGPITDDMAAAMAKKHPGEEVKIEMVDRYTIPTAGRIEQAKLFYRGVLTSDVTGFCFDEPEIWSNAGYSESFKAEWLAHYGTAWQPPSESVDARYQAEELKAFLIRRWVESILEDVKQQRGNVTRMLAMHSPTNYYEMGMSTPHYRLISIPALSEVVAEVWNDPFELTYLQYSSFWNLARGKDKLLWFMMDPWGDSPAMSLDYYRRSYGNNLLGALLFPGVDHFQALIWPNRLYGHVPKEYETLINTVAGAVAELWRYPDGRVESGNAGIGTFVADSMGWQRADPSPSDFDGYLGITLPLVGKGVPVDVLSLDRATEPGYLAAAHCLLLSYDFLKPVGAAQNQALAEWTRQGGTLVCFGGTDPYNAVKASWWARAGYATPLEELFARMGLPVTTPRVLATPGMAATLEPAKGTFGASAQPLVVPLGPSPGAVQARRRVNFWQSEEKPKEFSHTYAVTVYAPPPGATPLYYLQGTGEPVVWEARMGRGTVVFVGVAPGYLKTAAAGPDWIRTLARHALEKTGAAYREQPYFKLRRGPYTAVRTLDEPFTVPGRFVDLLSPTLAVLANPVIPPQESAFLIDAEPPAGGVPTPVVSGRLRASHETADVTSFLVQAPTLTNGVARVWAGPRRARVAAAATVLGRAVPVTMEAAGETLLLRYANEAEGVVVRVEWEPRAAAH